MYRPWETNWDFSLHLFRGALYWIWVSHDPVADNPRQGFDQRVELVHFLGMVLQLRMISYQKPVRVEGFIEFHTAGIEGGSY